MPNHDKLHTWWWGDRGPANAAPLTIGQLITTLQSALDTGVIAGISPAGWNYAVLKFLIEKCMLPERLRAVLIANANPKAGNYGIWRKHLKVQVTVKPHNSLRTNCTTPSNSLSISSMVNENTLKELIAKLQKIIVHDRMKKGSVEDVIKVLSDLGYQYDYKKFPTLKSTENFVDTSSETPQNLAEALLWKLGKWQSYKDFVANYTNDDSKPTKKNVVFFAFARHLKNKKSPIYDQHAIRALWAICGKLTATEKKKCKTLLFDGKGKWKQVGSGSVTIDCYELFVRHVNDLLSRDEEVSRDVLDRLFMPLGQAIKKSTASYDEFHQLCGWPIDG
ncbi:hypothetical protein D3OALGB2SA_3157 [Olavius algarvensis associated proteobacterium Delta 3]|nr:hypothetical protein D3OALGB2SA_3157 [Olavius algarvensis associated proteobacterium Delta 3]